MPVIWLLKIITVIWTESGQDRKTFFAPLYFFTGYVRTNVNLNGQVVDKSMWWATKLWHYTRDSYIHSDSNTHLKIIEFHVDNLHNFVYHSIKICDILLDFIQLSSEKRIWNSLVSRKNDLCARNIELGKVKMLHLHA